MNGGLDSQLKALNLGASKTSANVGNFQYRNIIEDDDISVAPTVDREEKIEPMILLPSIIGTEKSIVVADNRSTAPKQLNSAQLSLFASNASSGFEVVERTPAPRAVENNSVAVIQSAANVTNNVAVKHLNAVGRRSNANTKKHLASIQKSEEEAAANPVSLLKMLKSVIPAELHERLECLPFKMHKAEKARIFNNFMLEFKLRYALTNGTDIVITEVFKLVLNVSNIDKTLCDNQRKQIFEQFTKMDDLFASTMALGLDIKVRNNIGLWRSVISDIIACIYETNFPISTRCTVMSYLVDCLRKITKFISAVIVIKD